MSEWQPIETAMRGEHILFFPVITQPGRGVTHPPMIRIDNYPVSYPRKPTHWMPLPTPPSIQKEGG